MIDAGASNGVGEADPVLLGGNRVGYALGGLRHLLIAWIAQAALGNAGYGSTSAGSGSQR